MSTPEPERLPRGLKRLSLAAGPRPLRLATSSSTSPPITQSSPTPNPNTNGDPITHSHGRRMSSKRMSSISYYTPNSPSPMTSPALRSAPLIPERDRLDKGKQRDLSNPNGLQRSASYVSRRAATRADQDEDDDTRPKPPPVLTLAEKYAHDLFLFPSTYFNSTLTDTQTSFTLSLKKNPNASNSVINSAITRKSYQR